MSVPHQPTPRAAVEGRAAYLDALVHPVTGDLYAGLLVIDGLGRPLEFVGNRAQCSLSVLLPERLFWDTALPELAFTLFDACRSEPDLLICQVALGAPEWCRVRLAPLVPFALAAPAGQDQPAGWSWVSGPPLPGMRAESLAGALLDRGFATEPFERLRAALRELYLELETQVGSEVP